jgi:hypothetical protein
LTVDQLQNRRNTAIKDKIKDKKFNDIDIKTPGNFSRWFATITEVYDQMNIAAKKSELPKLIHLYNESEFVKDIIDKIGKYVISIKEDYTRDCRNRRKWDLARLRSRIEYMQIRSQLHDERDENSYTLRTKANAVNDDSRRNYDNDRYNDQRDIEREGQPRMDGREIIMREWERRLQASARESKRGRDTDQDKDKDNEWDRLKDKYKDWRQDPRQEQKKTKYNRPYEKRWCSICEDNGEEDWRCKTHNAVDCSRTRTRTSHQGHGHKKDTAEDNQRYTPDDIQRAKAIIAYEMQCHGLTTCASSTSRRGLPKETKQGMEESSDDDDDDEATTQQLKNYLGFDFDKRRRNRPY